MYRSMQTVDTAFKERLNEGGVAKAFPWSELRNCAMTDEDQEGLLALPLNAGHTLDEIKKQVANRPFFFAGELMQAGWETKNKTDEPKDRHKRADEVRSELNKFAQVAIYGGYWKGIQITPYTGPGDVHIVVVSHNNFLNVLTHRSALPSKLLNHSSRQSTDQPKTATPQPLGSTVCSTDHITSPQPEPTDSMASTRTSYMRYRRARIESTSLTL